MLYERGVYTQQGIRGEYLKERMPLNTNRNLMRDIFLAQMKKLLQ